MVAGLVYTHDPDSRSSAPQRRPVAVVAAPARRPRVLRVRGRSEPASTRTIRYLRRHGLSRPRKARTGVPSQRPSGFVAFGSGPEVLPTHQGRLCGTHRWRVRLALACRRGHPGVVTPLSAPTSSTYKGSVK